MKKALTVLLIALIAMTTVFAGGASESSSEGGVTTLTLAFWDVSQNNYINVVIDAFEAANPDIKIELQDTPSTEYITIWKSIMSEVFLK